MNLLTGSPYQGYAYGYPHKTAYRRLEPIPLREAWANERKTSLFLYLHVPFCEMRCGFCNLFTQAQPKEGMTQQFLNTLRVEADTVRAALGEATFARVAIGGGTPTFLDVAGLESLFRLVRDLGAARLPTSVETSPGTATAEKLACLRAHGVTRISMGIQSFVESEVNAVARPQTSAEVAQALENMRAARFPIMNLDLIYGLPAQTVASWLASLRVALEHRPEEMFLYPLYVRPLTGLARSERTWDDFRLDCYRAGRDLLLAEGYEQVSMRFFRLGGRGGETGPVYCCQDDGMVGLGCGARSYAGELHYARPFAVGARGIRAILADYLARPRATFDVADHGIRLTADEQRRRFVLQSLLQKPGLDRSAYRRRFGSDVVDDFPELAELERHELGELYADTVTLTAAGLERSDAIGPWFYSNRVRELMKEFELV